MLRGGRRFCTSSEEWKGLRERGREDIPGQGKGKSRALLEATAVFPMSYNGGSYSLTDFGGHGCDGVVGSEEGRNFGCILN